MLIARCTSPREMLSNGLVDWHRHDHPTLSVVKRGSRVAAKCGFADQSHMTRLVRLVTGVTPGQFQRRQITPVQDAQFPAAPS